VYTKASTKNISNYKFRLNKTLEAGFLAESKRTLNIHSKKPEKSLELLLDAPLELPIFVK